MKTSLIAHSLSNRKQKRGDYILNLDKSNPVSLDKCPFRQILPNIEKKHGRMAGCAWFLLSGHIGNKLNGWGGKEDELTQRTTHHPDAISLAITC